MKSLHIQFFQKFSLLLILLTSISQAFYIPRYSPAFFELYINGGAKTYSIKNSHTKPFDNTVPVFAIGGSINPFYIFVPDDHLTFFHGLFRLSQHFL